MLPSTGYFKGINCPFYDSGLCERPFCHFRHVKKDAHSLVGEGIENGTILQQLVSEAVKKVLQQSDSSGASAVQIVNDSDSTESTPAPLCKVTYNPTPIAELKKIGQADAEQSEENNEQKRRHIPVPYTPRKPPPLPIVRTFDTNGEYKPFVYNSRTAQYSPGSKETPKLDPYTPQGTAESKEKYVPGSDVVMQAYEPGETKINSVGYNPSDGKKKKILEYEPIKVGVKGSSLVYQPTPRSLAPCFSSDEDEPEVKKKKVSSDVNDFDDLGAEFDMLGEILDEEKPKDDSNPLVNLESYKKVVVKEKKSSSLHRNSKRDDKKENKDNHEKSKSSNHNNSSESKKSDKVSHKSSSKDKDRDKLKDKDDKSFSKDKDTDKLKDKDGKSSSKDKDRDKLKNKDNKSTIKDKDRTKDDRCSSKDKDKVKDKEHKSSSKDKDKPKDNKSTSRDKDKNRDKDDKRKTEKDTDSKKHSRSKSSEKSSKSSDKSSKSLDKSSSRHSSSKDKMKEHRYEDKRSSSEKSSHKSDKEKHKHSKHKDKPKVHENSSSDTEMVEPLDNNDDEELIEELSESDEESIALECKRIFEEYVPEAKPNPTSEEQPANEESYEYIPTKKRISHTADKLIKVIAKAPVKPDFKVSAAQKMAERLAKVKEYHAARVASTTSTILPKPEAITPVPIAPTHSNGKIRIAHVSFASTMVNAKRNIAAKSENTPNLPSTSSTISQTVKKGAQRVAHMPSDKFVDRPGVLEPLASKIPANIRSTYLNMMIDECLKIYLSPTDAYARAQHEELNTSKKCKAIQIYKNSAVLAVSRLRKELQECKGVKKSGSDCSQLQQLPVSGSWSIQNKNSKHYENPNEYRGAQLYENIKKWVLSEEELQENGFPRPHPTGDRGRAMIYAERKQKLAQGFYRTCCRCNKEYTVNKKGFPSVKEECVYHPNRKYRYRGEVKYQCCSQDGMSDGCCVASCHVYDYVDYANLKGYVTTMPPDKHSDVQGVYALDCEMCYTTHGLDLTRVTVINSSCQVVYETLIRPFYPIIDYNTKFSGITEEQMDSVKTTLLDVQATLLTMFNSKTILIGHSLESDFKALKLIHDTVIDTSVLYPHKMGPPYKRALRNLCSEYLKKIIQNSVDGHNSAEDAQACMELIHFKLKEDLKTR